MIKLKRKNTHFRHIFKKNELKAGILKNIHSNFYLNSGIRLESLRYILEPKIGSTLKTKLIDKCITTVSTKTLNKNFKLSRHELLRMIRLGKISGFKKSVW